MDKNWGEKSETNSVETISFKFINFPDIVPRLKTLNDRFPAVQVCRGFPVFPIFSPDLLPDLSERCTYWNWYFSIFDIDIDIWHCFTLEWQSTIELISVLFGVTKIWYRNGIFIRRIAIGMFVYTSKCRKLEREVVINFILLLYFFFHFFSIIQTLRFEATNITSLNEINALALMRRMSHIHIGDGNPITDSRFWKEYIVFRMKPLKLSTINDEQVSFYYIIRVKLSLAFRVTFPLSN